jgi:NAD+ diphosphatase
VDGVELEDARWFAYEEFRDMIKAQKVFVPPPVSIAYRLVEAWFDAQGGEKLSSIATWSYTRGTK